VRSPDVQWSLSALFPSCLITFNGHSPVSRTRTLLILAIEEPTVNTKYKMNPIITCAIIRVTLQVKENG